jgi:hypothetical protein
VLEVRQAAAPLAPGQPAPWVLQPERQEQMAAVSPQGAELSEEQQVSRQPAAQEAREQRA